MYSVHVGSRRVYSSTDKVSATRVLREYRAIYSWAPDTVRGTYREVKHG